MFTTPGGRPASANRGPSSSIAADASSDALSTAVLPAASAGPSWLYVQPVGQTWSVAASTPVGSSGSATIVVDVNPPSNASVVIAGGAPVILDNRNVSVDFGAWDYSGVAQMCYDQGGSDGSACQGSWVAFQPVVALTFSSDQVGTQHGS